MTCADCNRVLAFDEIHYCYWCSELEESIMLGEQLYDSAHCSDCGVAFNESKPCYENRATTATPFERTPTICIGCLVRATHVREREQYRELMEILEVE